MEMERSIVRKRIIIFIILYFSIVALIQIYNEKKELDIIVSGELKEEELVIERIFANSMSNHSKVIQNSINKIMADTRLTGLIKEQKREDVYRLLKDKYTNYTEVYPELTKTTFRDSEGRVFLRMHKPMLFGDTFGKKSNIINDTNRDKKVYSGFEISDSEIVYRIAIPIFHNDEYIGSVDVVVDNSYFIKPIKETYKVENAFLISSNRLSNSSGDKVEGKRVGNYILYKDDNEFFTKKIDAVDLDKSVVVDVDGTSYSVGSNLNLLDHRGGILAKLLIASNINRLNSYTNSLFWHSILLVLSMLIFTVLVFYITFNYYAGIIRKSQEKLCESKELYRITFHEAQVGIAQLGLDLTWIDVNKRMSEITGYTKKELIALGFMGITHPEDIEKDLDAVKKLCSGELQSYKTEKRYIHKNGNIIWIDLQASIVKKEGYGPVLIIAVIRDITKRKAVEFKLNYLNKNQKKEIHYQLEKLREQDDLIVKQANLAQMGDMINMIAHQWRQPLNAMSASAIRVSMLNRMNDLSQEEITKSMKFIQEKTQSMSQIINDFMNFNKESNDETFTLMEATENVRNIISAQFTSKSIELKIDVDKEIKVFHNIKSIEHSITEFTL